MKTTITLQAHRTPELVYPFSQSDSVVAEPPVNLSFAEDDLLDSHSKSIAPAVARVGAAVVSIRVDGANPGGRRGPEPGGSGLGFVIAPDGFILTNSHVVHGAVEMEVSPADGRVFYAGWVGDDPETDLAVILINASRLVPVQLGNLKSIRVGPVAIASNTTEFVQAQLIKEGLIRRSWIGVARQKVPMHRRAVVFHRLAVDHGVLALEIEPGRPASCAGLREPDVIVTFGGEPVSSIDELPRHLIAHVMVISSLTTGLEHTHKLVLVVTLEELARNHQRN